MALISGVKFTSALEQKMNFGVLLEDLDKFAGKFRWIFCYTDCVEFLKFKCFKNTLKSTSIYVSFTLKSS